MKPLGYAPRPSARRRRKPAPAARLAAGAAAGLLLCLAFAAFLMLLANLLSLAVDAWPKWEDAAARRSGLLDGPDYDRPALTRS